MTRKYFAFCAKSYNEADYRNADDDSGAGVVCHYFIGKHETAAE